MRVGRAQSRATGWFAAVGMAMLLLVLISQVPWMSGPRSAVRGLVAPFEAAATGLESGVGSAFSVFGDIASLRSENGRLASQNRQLQAQVATLQAAGAENDALRRDLNFQNSFGHRMVTAAVIGRGPDAFARVLTIDRGTADGIQPGMVVVTGYGLVGRVKESAGHSATVQTVADPLTRVNAYTVSSNLEGTVSGGPGALQMEVMPKADVVAQTGEWALTSGIGGTYPRGIPVGRVVAFDRRDTAVAQIASLAWANDLASISAVMVVTDFTPR